MNTLFIKMGKRSAEATAKLPVELQKEKKWLKANFKYIEKNTEEYKTRAKNFNEECKKLELHDAMIVAENERDKA